MRRGILGDIATTVLCGKTSPLYARLYEERLINASFDVEYNLFPQAACAVFGGESRDPRAVRDAILDEAGALALHGVDEALFERVRNARYGMMLRALDEPDDFARMQVEAAFGGEEMLNFPAIFAELTARDVQDMLARWARPDRATLSVVEPLS